jgi:hypothetical protein
MSLVEVRQQFAQCCRSLQISIGEMFAALADEVIA